MPRWSTRAASRSWSTPPRSISSGEPWLVRGEDSSSTGGGKSCAAQTSGLTARVEAGGRGGLPQRIRRTRRGGPMKVSKEDVIGVLSAPNTGSRGGEQAESAKKVGYGTEFWSCRSPIALPRRPSRRRVAPCDRAEGSSLAALRVMGPLGLPLDGLGGSVSKSRRRARAFRLRHKRRPIIWIVTTQFQNSTRLKRL